MGNFRLSWLRFYPTIVANSALGGSWGWIILHIYFNHQSKPILHHPYQTPIYFNSIVSRARLEHWRFIGWNPYNCLLCWLTTQTDWRMLASKRPIRIPIKLIYRNRKDGYLTHEMLLMDVINLSIDRLSVRCSQPRHIQVAKFSRGNCRLNNLFYF